MEIREDRIEDLLVIVAIENDVVKKESNDAYLGTRVTSRCQDPCGAAPMRLALRREPQDNCRPRVHPPPPHGFSGARAFSNGSGRSDPRSGPFAQNP